MIRPRYTTLLVDHDPHSEAQIRARLARDAELAVIGGCRDAGSALHAIAERRPDLLLLDVNLPQQDGFRILAALGEVPAVVFLTTREEDAVRAFGFTPADCLLRPFTNDRLDLALRRAKNVLNRRAGVAAQGYPAFAPHGVRPGVSRGLDRFLVRNGGRLMFVDAADVRWIESAANYVRLRTAMGEHRVRMKIGEVAQLGVPDFVRIHRTIIVNLRFVEFLAPTTNGDHRVHLTDGTVLRLSRTYCDAVLTDGVLNRASGA